MARGSSTGTWTGQVTVVECIADCAASGFTLVRVNEVTMTMGVTSATDSTGGAWGSGNLGQIGLYGGIYGGGIQTTETGLANHKTAWARIWPSGADTVNLSRSNTGPGEITGTTDFSVYVVQWGSEWNIQRANVTGSAGGNGMNLTSHYNTATISSVARADTWVIAYGQVDDATLGAGWDGHSFTLGDGVNQNTNETLVAVGAEIGAQRDVEVYIHTHTDLFNQYVFGPDGVAPGIVDVDLSGTVTIQGPKSPETHNSSDTAGRRFPIVANSSAGGGTSFPRSIVWGQLDADTAARDGALRSHTASARLRGLRQRRRLRLCSVRAWPQLVVAWRTARAHEAHMWPIVRAGVRPARSDEENPRGKHRQSRADRHSALPDPPCSAMASGSKDGGRSRSLDKLRTDAAVECRAVSRSLADQMGTKRPFRGLSEVCSGIVLSGTQFTEIEYAVEATTSATDGAVYCFRLTDAGNPTNFTSTEYGQVTLS